MESTVNTISPYWNWQIVSNMIQLMHLFLTSMAEGIFCDFCADTTRTIAQKTTVNVTDSNIFRLCIIMARKYTFFVDTSLCFCKGRANASGNCVPPARCPRALSAHPTLRPNGLMWGYWNIVPLARIVRFVTNIIIPSHITRRFDCLTITPIGRLSSYRQVSLVSSCTGFKCFF